MSDSETVSLKAHFDALFAERDKQLSVALKAQRDATEAVRDMAQTRFVHIERSTELAARLLDQRLIHANGAFPRGEHEQFAKRVDGDIRELRESRAELKGKASQTQLMLTFIVAAWAAISGTAALVVELAWKR